MNPASNKVCFLCLSDCKFICSDSSSIIANLLDHVDFRDEFISNYDDPFTSSAHKLEYEFVMPLETSPSPSDSDVGGFFMLFLFLSSKQNKNTDHLCFYLGQELVVAGVDGVYAVVMSCLWTGIN